MTQVNGQTPCDIPCGIHAKGRCRCDKAHACEHLGFMPPAFQGVDPVAPKRHSDYATYIRLHCRRAA